MTPRPRPGITIIEPSKPVEANLAGVAEGAVVVVVVVGSTWVQVNEKVPPAAAVDGVVAVTLSSFVAFPL
jgi:hypothetical protein